MKRAILGDVEFSVVESEEPIRENQITEKPVEYGVDIADHVQPRALVFSISGMVSGENAAQKLSQLVMYRDNAEILTYVGRNLIHNLVIESLKTTHAARVRDGFEFELLLKQVTITNMQTATYVKADPAQNNVAGDAATKTQTNSIKNKGTQLPLSQNVDIIKEVAIKSLALAKFPNPISLLGVGASYAKILAG